MPTTGLGAVILAAALIEPNDFEVPISPCPVDSGATAVVAQYQPPDNMPIPGEPSTHTAGHVLWSLEREPPRLTPKDHQPASEWFLLATGHLQEGSPCDLVWGRRHRHEEGDDPDPSHPSDVWDLAITQAFEVPGDKALIVGSLSVGARIVGFGDFDNDGGKDVLLWTSAGLEMWASWNGRVLGVKSPVTVEPQNGTVAVAVAQIDGDGVPDVVWTLPEGNLTYGSISLQGNAFEHLFSRVRLLESDVPRKLAAVGDFDGDGRSDVLWEPGREGLAVSFGGNAVLGFGPPIPIEPAGLGHSGFPGYSWRVAAPR